MLDWREAEEEITFRSATGGTNNAAKVAHIEVENEFGNLAEGQGLWYEKWAANSKGVTPFKAYSWQYEHD